MSIENSNTIVASTDPNSEGPIDYEVQMRDFLSSWLNYEIIEGYNSHFDIVQFRDWDDTVTVDGSKVNFKVGVEAFSDDVQVDDMRLHCFIDLATKEINIGEPEVDNEFFSSLAKNKDDIKSQLVPVLREFVENPGRRW